jgi:outer membrane immunogenic protein
MSTSKTLSTLVIAIGAGAAQAADIPSNKSAPLFSAPPPPAFSWTGSHVGVNVGGAFTADDVFGWNPPGTNAGQASGVVGGAQLGFDYQLTPLFVLGIENDFQGSSVSTRNDGFYFHSVDLRWFRTTRGRVGLTFMDSRLLVYGTGGVAFGQPKDGGVGQMRTGWSAGGGVEWAFMPRWSAKFEYLHTELHDDFKIHTIRVGVNYHFNPIEVLSRAASVVGH